MKALTIRRLRPSDAEALYRILSDRQVMRVLEPPLVYGTEEGGRLLGYVIYHAYDPDSMELGWVLARNEWGKGYAGALNKMLIEQARKAGMDAVIECSPEQAATKAIAEKHGFAYCGMDSGCEVYRLKLRAE